VKFKTAKKAVSEFLNIKTMKSFFKYVLATITGIFILAFLFIGIMVASIANLSKKEKVEVSDESILKLQFNYPITDAPVDDATALFSAFNPEFSSPVSLLQILQQIDRAAEDEKIKGIYLDMSFIGAGFGKTSEIRSALERFKESGKFIYAYSKGYYPQSYYLASVADSVFLHPEGNFVYNGLLADVVFLKDMFEKLGIDMQVIKHGKFKGATETFERNSLSEENRYQIKAYVESIYGNITRAIAQSRELSEDSLISIADEMKIRRPEHAVEHQLVDGLIYHDEMMDILRRATNTKEDEKIQTINLAKYASSGEGIGKGKNRIAIVYAEGDIVDGKGDGETVGGETFANTFSKLRKDEDIKAIVLRINSPGGSALASDEIYREVMLTRKEKPVIVSMGDVAASGGYYIAALADTIVALPNSITGSIGVFGVIPNTQELMNDKLGIKMDYVGTGKHSEFGRIDRPMTDYEQAYFREMIDSIYGQFVSIVSAGRNMPHDMVDSLAQGRVYTGAMAKEIGLTDVNGDLLDALEIAAWKAGIEDYKIRTYPKRKNPFEEMLNQIGAQSSTNRLIESTLGEYLPILKQIEYAKSVKGAQMRMPYLINFSRP
jgi:protease-4